MKNKSFDLIVGAILAIAILVGVFATGFYAGRMTGSPGDAVLFDLSPLSLGKEAQTQTTSEPQAVKSETPDELIQPFWEAWDIVDEMFVDQPLDHKLLMRGAIRGMVEALGDEHSSYMDPVTYERVNDRLNGDYEGIGAWVDATGDYLTIISPMPGSPAEKAGLKSNDKVIAIDGEDMTGIDAELARQKVLGPKGSKVTLTIWRQGNPEPFDVVIERAAIVIPSVVGKMLEDDVAYVQLVFFGDETDKDLEKTLKELLAKKPKGLILDLRDNGGGFLQTAIDVASEFIGDGLIMHEQYGDGRLESFNARRGGLATKIPMVVLINQGSASASEIVAGAIQDRGRGYLVGKTSYGKGSVQSYIELDDNEGALRVTVARWLTPNQRQINEVGLDPDFPVEISEQDAAAEKDTQLEQAIAVLLKKLVPLPTPVVTPTASATPTP